MTGRKQGQDGLLGRRANHGDYHCTHPEGIYAVCEGCEQVLLASQAWKLLAETLDQRRLAHDAIQLDDGDVLGVDLLALESTSRGG